MPFKFDIPCFVEFKSKILGIEALARFWTINKRNLSHMSSKSVPISIAVFYFRVKSDESPADSQIKLNNSMNI